MLRVAYFKILVAGLFSLAAYQSGSPKFPKQTFPVNSTIATFGDQDMRYFSDGLIASDADSVAGLHVLMLNYSSYDSAYVGKVRGLITQRLPGVVLTDFWAGSDQTLKELLASQQIVVVPYAATGDPKLIGTYGKVLQQFVRKGGAVVFSGTDQFGVLQHFGLFDLDFGYFCTELEIHANSLEHPILQGTQTDFTLANYIYPLDIPDPSFVSLADIRGYTALGYKPIGTGKVVYLGFEYYYDEFLSSLILENTLRWLSPVTTSNPAAAPEFRENNTPDWAARSVRRSQETLFAGSGRQTAVKTPDFELKIYPNPYFEKATVDLNLEKPGPVMVEMTDETGVTFTVLLPNRMLNAGSYRLDLPNVSPGVYFVKCRIGMQTTVRKVVKTSVQ
ncbi:MAG: T9SS type A sorting domain-containing protein [Saprospiraceae bacterium]